MTDHLKLENQICFKIYTLERKITQLYRDLLEELEVTYPQYLVLLVLWDENYVTVKKLGEKLFLDSGTLTPMLKRMENNGLIERRRSLEDERSVIISLSDKGAALKEKADCIPSQLIEKFPMNQGDLKSLDHMLSSALIQLQLNKN